MKERIMRLLALLRGMIGISLVLSPYLVVGSHALPETNVCATRPTVDTIKDTSAQPTPLPGKGLAQHPFLYTGEWDTRKTVQTIFIVRGGKVVWTYSIPIKDERAS